MSRTKIVVIQLKEIVYTAIFVGLGILLIILLVFMFLPNSKNESASSTDVEYAPGIYTTQLTIGDTQLNLEVAVDENHINSVNLINIDESISTMYPLVEPAVESISKQLAKDVSIEDIALEEDSKYTQELLLAAVSEALKKAQVTNEN